MSKEFDPTLPDPRANFSKEAQHQELASAANKLVMESGLRMLQALRLNEATLLPPPEDANAIGIGLFAGAICFMVSAHPTPLELTSQSVLQALFPVIKNISEQAIKARKAEVEALKN